MAILSTQWLTIMDVAARMDPNGQLADIGEIISKATPLLSDAPLVEGNRPDGTVHTTRSKNGTAVWRRPNRGGTPSKTSTTQFADVVGFLDAWTQSDEKVAQMSGNIPKFIADEEAGEMQGMSEQAESAVFYANSTANPEQFTGIAPRFAAYGSNVRTSHVFNAGGIGADCTSIYLIGWGLKTCHLLYPRGSVAGLNRTSLGKLRVTDTDGNPFMAHCTHYTWDLGLGLPDWRSVVRIANVDYSDLETAGDPDGVAPNLIKMMVRALHLLPQGKQMKPVFYAHPDVVALLAVQAMDKAKTLSIGDVKSENGLVTPGVLQLLGHPIHGSEQILLTETALVV